LTRCDEERKKIYVEIQTSPKLEELIKLLIDFMDSIKDFIEEKKFGGLIRINSQRLKD
jgi:hypothetical protein